MGAGCWCHESPRERRARRNRPARRRAARPGRRQPGATTYTRATRGCRRPQGSTCPSPGPSRTDPRASSGTGSIRTRCPWRRRRRRRGSRARVILRRVRIPETLCAEWPHEQEWLAAAAARGRVRRRVGSRAGGAVRHAPVARRTGRRRCPEAERAVAFRGRPRGGRAACWDGRGAVRLLAWTTSGMRSSSSAAYRASCSPRERRRGLDHGRAPGATARRRADRHSFRLLADEADRWMEEVPRRWEVFGKPSSVAPRAPSTSSATSTALRPGSSTRTSMHGTSSAPSASRGS